MMASHGVSTLRLGLDPRPKTILECYEDGKIDITKVFLYQQRSIDERRRTIKRKRDLKPEHENKEKKKRQKRNRRSSVVQCRDEKGIIRDVHPTESNWYVQYISCPSHSNQFFKKFRRRFRLTYHEYLTLVEESREKQYFPSYMRKDAAGRDSSPLELMILGALRYLGRGWTFDDIEENTAVSEETHRSFLHDFITCGSTILFRNHVESLQPSTATEAKQHMHEYSVAGVPGAIGSTDTTHVLTEMCTYRLRNAHRSFKLQGTARAFNLTSNHRRQILATTCGFPASWNDKTLILFDTFVGKLHGGGVPLGFELLERNASGEIVTVKYKGAWLIVDNGYLDWSVTVPPFSITTSQKEVRWSQWIESLRKDVECTFGILKGRWRILKTGIRLHGVEAADKVWRTCCALHNRLLEADGLHERWESGVPSDWEGELGQHDANDAREYVPFAIQRLRGPGDHRCAYDSCSAMMSNSGVNVGESVEGQHHRHDQELLPGVARNVTSMSLSLFRKKLVEHFDIKWSRNDLKWPRANRQAPTFSNDIL
jgi:hypothetical protein